MITNTSQTRHAYFDNCKPHTHRVTIRIRVMYIKRGIPLCVFNFIYLFDMCWYWYIGVVHYIKYCQYEYNLEWQLSNPKPGRMLLYYRPFGTANLTLIFLCLIIYFGSIRTYHIPFKLFVHHSISILERKDWLHVTATQWINSRAQKLVCESERFLHFWYIGQIKCDKHEWKCLSKKSRLEAICQ